LTSPSKRRVIDTPEIRKPKSLIYVVFWEEHACFNSKYFYKKEQAETWMRNCVPHIPHSNVIEVRIYP